MERSTPMYSASERVHRGGSTYCVSIWPRASTSCGVGVGDRDGDGDGVGLGLGLSPPPASVVP